MSRRRANNRKLLCKKLVDQRCDEVSRFLAGDVVGNVQEVTHTTNAHHSSGESEEDDDEDVDINNRQNLTTNRDGGGNKTSLNDICAHFSKGRCLLGSYCLKSHIEEPHYGGVAVQQQIKQSITYAQPRWFWLEKAAGYHEPTRWRACLDAGQFPEVDEHTMYARGRPVQKLLVFPQACWAAIMENGMEAFPREVNEHLEYQYSTSPAHRCALAWHGGSNLVDFYTMELRLHGNNVVYPLVRQPLTLRLPCRPSNLTPNPTLNKPLMLSDPDGTPLIMTDMANEIISHKSCGYELPCKIDCTEWVTHQSEACPDGGSCEDTSLAHTASCTHPCPMGKRCYFHHVHTTAHPHVPRDVTSRADVHCAYQTHENAAGRGVVTGLGLHETMAFRGRWGVVKSNEVKLVTLTEGSAEWCYVGGYGVGSGCGVERVCSQELWMQYLFTRQSVAARNGGVLVEKMLFTQADRYEVALIITKGFNSGRRMPSKKYGTGPYGNGRHFHTTYAAARDALPTPPYILMALVCVGSSCFCDDPTCTTPPPEASKHHDSTCDTYDPTQAETFVVYEGQHAYPTYIITVE